MFVRLSDGSLVGIYKGTDSKAAYDSVLPLDKRIRKTGVGCYLLENGDVVTIAFDYQPTSTVVLSGVADLAGGATKHQCAVKKDGTAWCWGENSYGQLGIGGLQSASVPTQVENLPKIKKMVVFGDPGTGGIPPFKGFSCALAEGTGAVYCWGYNGEGQLGTGDNVSLSTPAMDPVVVGAKDISVGVADYLGGGYGTVYATMANGTVFMWGDVPVTAAASPGVKNYPVQVPGVTTAIMTSGVVQTACSLLEDGSVHCWGDHSLDNGVGDVRAIAMVKYFPQICAVKNDASLWCWGTDSDGKPLPSPVPFKWPAGIPLAGSVGSPRGGPIGGRVEGGGRRGRGAGSGAFGPARVALCRWSGSRAAGAGC
jgi:hypothetical protein